MPILPWDTIFKGVKSASSGVGTVLDYLGRPSRAGAGAVRALEQGQSPIDFALANFKGERNDTYGDVLRDLGAGPATSAVGGFAADVALDPLMFVGKAAKAAGLYNKAREGVLGTMKGFDAGKNIINKFSKYENLPAEFQTPRRVLDSEIIHHPHTIEKKVRGIYEGSGGHAITIDEERAALRGLEEGTANLPANVDRGRVQSMVDKSRQLLDEMHAEETGAGVMPEPYLPGYAPRIFRKPEFAPKFGAALHSTINAKNPHGLARKLQTFDEFLNVKNAEPIDTLFEALLARGVRGGKAASTGRFLKDLAANKTFAADVATAPAHYKEITPGKYGKMTDLVNTLSGKVFDPEVAANINKLTAVETPDNSLEGLRKLMQAWKTSATVMRPGHHATNFKGNEWNAALGGTSIRGLVDMATKRPKTLLSELSPDAAEFASKHGIVGGATHTMRDIAGPKGQAAVDDVLGRKAPITGPLDAVKRGFKGWANFGRSMGSTIEDSAKLSFFKDYIERNPNKLQGPELLTDALMKTKRHLFDYNELTPFEQNLKLAMPFYCVPEDTQILTKKGWQHYSEINVGDLTLTYNIGTDRLEWQPIEEIAVFDYDQDITVLANKRHVIKCTDNHRWAVLTPSMKVKRPYGTYEYPSKREILETCELNTGHKIIVSAPLVDGGESILTPRDAELLGWLLTDGTWRWKNNSLCASIYQSLNKPETFKEVERVSETYPGKINSKNCSQFHIKQIRLAGIKHLLRRRKTDSWADIIMGLNREAAEAMYNAMYNGDGVTSKKRKQESFACMIDSVGEAFELLATLLGKRIVKSTKGYYPARKRYMSVALMTKGYEHYTGKVWCPRTANGTWVMKQGKFITAVGNTFFKKNLPIQLEGLIERPQQFSGFEHFRNEARGLVPQGQKVTPAGTPDYVKEQGGFQFPSGDPNKATFYNPYLPFNDLNTVLDPRDTINRLAPWIKAPIELSMNKSAFTKYPIYNDKLTFAEGMLKDTIKRNLPVLGETQVPKGVDYLMQNLPIVNALSKSGASAEEFLSGGDTPAALINFITGAGMVPQSHEQVGKNVKRKAQAERAHRSALANIKKKR